MALYAVNETVFTNKVIGTDACGDHPYLHHAKRGEEFIVLKYNPAFEYCYLIGKSVDDKYSFWVSPLDLMSQKPFNH